MVYAAVTALGFAATENVYYIYRMGFLESKYEGLIALAFVRIILVGWQHPFYTSFTGVGLAVARLNKNTAIKITAPVIGWCLAVFLHSIHNTLVQLLKGAGGLILSTFLDWSGWIFMFCVVLIAIWSEQKTIAAQLREEVPLGTLSAQQYKTACSTWAQSVARLGGLVSGGYQSTNRFYQLAAELAHKKYQLSRMGEEMANSQIIDRLRQDLIELSPLARS